MYGEIWQRDGQNSTDPIVTYCDLHLEEDAEVCDALTTLLADLFALYVKIKVFHWHVSGLSSHGGHLVLAEQADQVLVTIDTIGERVRALGGTPIRSIGEISRLHWIRDGASADPNVRELLAAMLRDSRMLAKQMGRN